MLLEAEKIRAKCREDGNIEKHATCMANMLMYADSKGLLTGNIFQGTASEEKLNQAAEMAACLLEVVHEYDVGPILDLPDNKKLEIIELAKEKTLANLRRHS